MGYYPGQIHITTPDIDGRFDPIPGTVSSVYATAYIRDEEAGPDSILPGCARILQAVNAAAGTGRESAHVAIQALLDVVASSEYAVHEIRAMPPRVTDPGHLDAWVGINLGHADYVYLVQLRSNWEGATFGADGIDVIHRHANGFNKGAVVGTYTTVAECYQAAADAADARAAKARAFAQEVEPHGPLPGAPEPFTDRMAAHAAAMRAEATLAALATPPA